MVQQVTIGGRLLGYLDSAPTPDDVAQDAGVLVLLHAFPLNARMWQAEVASPPAGWRFLAPDLRGCGASDAGPEVGPNASLDDYAADVLALLDHLGVSNAVVAGLSMGGYTAFALLRLAPGRVRGLVLSNTKAPADDEQARAGRRDMLAVLEHDGVGAVAGRMLPRLLGETTRTERPETARQVGALAEGNSAAGVRGALVRMMNRPDSTPLLSGIACPTLIIASDEDLVTPVEQARAMQQRIPGAELTLIPRAGHLSNLEQPAAFGAALHRFVTTRFGG